MGSSETQNFNKLLIFIAEFVVFVPGYNSGYNSHLKALGIGGAVMEKLHYIYGRAIAGRKGGLGPVPGWSLLVGKKLGEEICMVVFKAPYAICTRSWASVVTTHRAALDFN
jgi:hypothetical protein